jgi:hypothetical protein
MLKVAAALLKYAGKGCPWLATDCSFRYRFARGVRRNDNQTVFGIFACFYRICFWPTPVARPGNVLRCRTIQTS